MNDMIVSPEQSATTQRKTAVRPPNAPGEIHIRFVDGPAATFELLWSEAPAVCAAVIAGLPTEADCFHAIYSGTVAAFLMDPDVVAPDENATTCLQPGDLLFTHYDADFRHGHAEALSEVYWAYDRYARPTIPGQFIPLAAPVFGRYVGSDEDWIAFAGTCGRLRFDGVKRLRIDVS